MQRTECDGPGCHNPPRPWSGTGTIPKYCSRACSQRRYRVNRGEAASGRTPGELVSEETERAAAELLREELRPHVREAITDEVIVQIKDLIKATPLAIAELIKQLKNPDVEIRQKAAKEILRHTTGNKAIVPDINADRQQDLIVHFALPRPDDPTPNGPLDAPPEDLRQCDSCQSWKTPREFEGSSDRCTDCFEKMQKIGEGIVTRTAGG